LDGVVSNFDVDLQKKIIICFNINIQGFNVFTTRNEVEHIIFKKSSYKKMGMSILSSGGTKSIKDSLNYIRNLPLDYVVYGSSNLKNIEDNFNFLK